MYTDERRTKKQGEKIRVKSYLSQIKRDGERWQIQRRKENKEGTKGAKEGKRMIANPRVKRVTQAGRRDDTTCHHICNHGSDRLWPGDKGRECVYKDLDGVWANAQVRESDENVSAQCKLVHGTT